MTAQPLSLLDAALRVFPDVFLFDGGRYVVATLLMTAIVALVLRSPWRVRRLQSRSAAMADRQRELLASLRSVIIYALVATPALWLRANGFGGGFHEGEPSIAGTLAWVGVLLVAHDTWFYWMHRTLHHRRLFRHCHALHHKSVTPTPFAAYSFNALEAMFEALFVSLWVTIVPTPFTPMFIFLGIMIIRNVMGHSGVELMPKGFADHWFWGLFATTTHHDLHHNGSFNHNFGLYFTVWDRLMGTEHPRYREIFREVTSRPPARREAIAA
ncbi:sterol desaturase family protein [Sandarakinorhabdus rubra]|uniref:sterol desaturase family protein n=1 Tax=Sandarakinorhabdus rubra TaxID=2672568 RepID=UPI0013D94A27|nr:sterol desaturase family protein [Sandarakinorhabdus rubra]